MESGLAIEELSRESEVEREGAGACRVGIGGVRAEGVGIPGPHRRIVARASDLAGRVELVAVDVVDRDGRSIRAQGGDGGVAQPDGLFDQSPSAIVFAQQVAGFVVGVENGAVDAA